MSEEILVLSTSQKLVKLRDIGFRMISREDFERALQSPDVQRIAQLALDFLRSKGLERNVAAYDGAILFVIQERRLTYEEHGAVIQLLCNPWMLENQESGNE